MIVILLMSADILIGTLGQSLKLNADVFLSSDAGLTWHQVRNEISRVLLLCCMGIYM